MLWDEEEQLKSDGESEKCLKGDSVVRGKHVHFSEEDQKMSESKAASEANEEEESEQEDSIDADEVLVRHKKTD